MGGEGVAVASFFAPLRLRECEGVEEVEWIKESDGVRLRTWWWLWVM
jgi:hypothetical protein